jgi:hypothetical protein
LEKKREERGGIEMKRMWPALIGTALVAPAFGQSVGALYIAGKLIKEQSIELTNWGSGTIAETDEQGLEQNRSLRVSTRNFFQGGVLHYDNPLDESKACADKNNLLRVTFRLAGEDIELLLKLQNEPEKDTTISAPGNEFNLPKRGQNGGPGGGKGGSTGGPGAGGGTVNGGKGGKGGQGGSSGGGAAGGAFGGGAGSPGRPGSGTAGGGKQGGPGSPGSPGAPGMGNKNTMTTTLMKTMRVIITTTDGKHAEAYLPITSSMIDDRAWREIAIPLQAINGLDQTNHQIKEIALSGDTTQTFYVGEISVVNDQTPISGEVNAQDGLNLALGDTVTLIGRGTGGSSVLKYSWDFDDSDGIQVDSEGQVMKHKFRKAGDFNVTLTISDAYGLKKAYTTTFKVHVNP